MSKRDRQLITILGATRMGKTRLAKAYFAAHPGPTKIVADPGSNWEKGEFPADGFESKKALGNWLDEITGKGLGPPHSKRVGLEGGLLVLDDADCFPGISMPISKWSTLWNRYAHFRLDVIVTGHRPQTLPKDLFANSSQIIMFNMEEPYALKYLAEINGLQQLASGNLAIPTEPGNALVWNRKTRTLSYMKTF